MDSDNKFKCVHMPINRRAIRTPCGIGVANFYKYTLRDFLF